MIKDQLNETTKELGDTLLETALLLLVSGASTGRIRKTIERISGSFTFTSYMLISQRTIMLNMYNKENDCVYNSLKRAGPHQINFTLISGISRISWQLTDEKWDVKRIKKELTRICSLSHYPAMVSLALTGLAGAAFCRLAGGAPLDMLVVFFASATGLFVRHKASKMNYNSYLCVFFAAFTASFIAGGFVKLNIVKAHETAFATSVLFLIPGVPLINAFSDLIDGNLQNGLIRGLNGFIISFSIALGLLTSMAIYRF